MMIFRLDKYTLNLVVQSGANIHNVVAQCQHEVAQEEKGEYPQRSFQISR